MPKRTWEVVLDGHSHLIQLNHGIWTSSHDVWLNDCLLHYIFVRARYVYFQK